MSFGSMTNGQLILIGIVILLLVLIFPRLIRRRRINKEVMDKQIKKEKIRPEDFSGETKLFYTHNGKSSEIEETVSSLGRYAKKHGMKVVFPGSFTYEGIKSPTSMILVGPFGLLLIRCYGFGGHIYYDEEKHSYMQNMNETIKTIPNPVHSAIEEQDRMIAFLKGTPYENTPVRSASVFTRNDIILSVSENSNIYSRKTLLEWLKNPAFEKDNGVPAADLTDWLVEQIKGPEVSKKT